MRTRPLGRTGIQVSAYCLGTMMFGRVGNPDHDDCVRIIHRALDAGINVIDTSNFPASDIVEAQRVAERRGLARFRTEQPPYSLLNRGIEREVLPVCERYDMGIALAHTAMAFTVAHPGVSAAIIGPRTMEHLDDLLAGAGTVLGDDLLDRIDEIVPPGADIGPLDVSYDPSPVTRPALRRRPAGERSAA